MVWIRQARTLRGIEHHPKLGAHHLRSRGASYAQASWGAAAVTATAGIGKELWDRSHHSDFSYRDLAADGVGLMAGAVWMRQIDR